MVTADTPTRRINPAGSVSHCDRCGGRITRKPGARGPLPRRCDRCRDETERRTRLRSRVRESIVLAGQISNERIERQLRNTLAELEGEEQWTGLGE
jgi:hypothetical protein